MIEYALYKGDELLAIGTVVEIAEKLGIKTNTVYHYGTPSYKKKSSKSKNGYRVLIKLEE